MQDLAISNMYSLQKEFCRLFLKVQFLIIRYIAFEVLDAT